METNERILALVKEKGPLLPVQVSKEINDTILMTSARLSELLSNKQIKISHVKVGGSPLYYFQGQENKLQDYSNNLVEKEKEAYELLKKNKILKDVIQDPSIRVALRQIRDFAVPLQVNYQNTIEIFWKWYLLDNDESQLLIKNTLSKLETKIKDKTIEDVTKTEPQKELNQETQKKLPKETEKEITKKPKQTFPKISFLTVIEIFFNKNKLDVLETNLIKKNSEIDFVVELQTSIGNVKYFCKSKNKKKISEGDIGSALVQAQSKNLPLLFLTKGDLTKKAKEMLGNEFKNIVFKKI